MTNSATTTITRATLEHAPLIANLGRKTFIESHGHSAAAADIESYVEKTYNYTTCLQELSDVDNQIYILYQNGVPAGYSKVIFNVAHPNIPLQPVTKLERLYLLQDFYGAQLGKVLLNFNIELAKQNNQKGIWLFAWTENARANTFYSKAGFEIIGSHDFQISANHSNPNHQMLLTF